MFTIMKITHFLCLQQCALYDSCFSCQVVDVIPPDLDMVAVDGVAVTSTTFIVVPTAPTKPTVAIDRYEHLTLGEGGVCYLP